MFQRVADGNLEASTEAVRSPSGFFGSRGEPSNAGALYKNCLRDVPAVSWLGLHTAGVTSSKLVLPTIIPLCRASEFTESGIFRGYSKRFALLFSTFLDHHLDLQSNLHNPDRKLLGYGQVVLPYRLDVHPT